ncbi:hypothetical protein NLI96_g10690 [Meripilus lineatus]|uniref:F-box domain-containing protein n=1 Tax=Meripilus lineatus TaxID=2056292 RepID=A0AAD5UTG9_9APHY|nr:hypothetical protein NLI96_g10690 [Physisporinus lineatus]
MGASVLPTEVWERVIDWVPYYEHRKDSRNTLYACSLVCRSWVHRSQFHLFVRIELSNTRQANSFIDILAHSPVIASGLRVLIISPSRSKAKPMEKIPSCFYNWIYVVLATLPPLLPHLEALEFRGLPILHPNFILMASRFKTIRRLRLHNIVYQSFSEIIRLINRFSLLQTLEVYNVQWNQPSSCYPSKRHRIKELISGPDNGCQSDMLNWMCSSQSIVALHSLKLHAVDVLLVPTLNTILHLCMRSLQTLAIHFTSGIPDNLALPGFAGHLALKSLDLRNIPFQALVTFLSRPTQAIPSGIRVLQVSLRPAKYEATFDTKNQPDWRKIDQALKNRKLEHLDALVIWTTPVKGGDALYENIRIACEGALPKAFESGVLCWGNLNTRFGAIFYLVTCV